MVTAIVRGVVWVSKCCSPHMYAHQPDLPSDIYQSQSVKDRRSTMQVSHDLMMSNTLTGKCYPPSSAYTSLYMLPISWGVSD